METNFGEDQTVLKLLRPPNRKKFEDDLEVINEEMKSKESQQKSLIRLDEKTQVDLKNLQLERQMNIEKRQSTDEELRKLSGEITKHENEITAVQSNLQYKREDRIDEAIKRLEDQLKVRNFKLLEERKIVAEIDSLKRSKKALGGYLALKNQIDEKRSMQRKLRDSKDRFQKEVSTIKQKEEFMKKEARNNKALLEELRQDLQELQRKSKQMQNDFSVQEKEYRQQKEERKKQLAGMQRSCREKVKRTNSDAYEIAEYETTCIPFAAEKHLCSTLVTYLKRFVVSSDDPEDKPTCLSLDSSQELQKSLEAEGMFLLRRKLDDEEQKNKLLKRGKKEKRRLANKKPIVHTPEIFEQFAKLGLTAPSVVVDVQASINQLLDKISCYDNLSTTNQVASALVSEVKRLSECEPNLISSAMSYTESIPTTPEVQYESIRMLLMGDGFLPRKLSRDSGTCEFDDQQGTSPNHTPSTEEQMKCGEESEEQSRAKLDAQRTEGGGSLADSSYGSYEAQSADLVQSLNSLHVNQSSEQGSSPSTVVSHVSSPAMPADSESYSEIDVSRLVSAGDDRCCASASEMDSLMAMGETVVSS